LVLHNGKIATVDENFSIQEAVAVAHDKIIFIGSDEDVQKFISDGTKVIDLNGKLALPGLIDAHAHLHSLGNELSYLNITGSTSFEEIVNKVAERVKTAEPGEWIMGGRWDHTNWKSNAFIISVDILILGINCLLLHLSQ